MYGSGTEAQNVDQDGYDSDGLEAVTKRYGASGSSAYMSDDIYSILAPLVSLEMGHRTEKCFKPLFERKRKSR